MKDKDFSKISQWQNDGAGLIPVNQKAQGILDQCKKGDILDMIEVTARDLSFHKCWMSLLGYIWDFLTPAFKNKCPRDKFYIFLKELKKDYTITMIGKIEMKDYISISFSSMTEIEFREYIKDTLPFIYENVIHALFDVDKANNIINTIENDYLKFLEKL
jgi:hypothetical protein